MLKKKETTGKLDKTSFSIYNRGEEPSNNNYWLSKTPQERIAAIEMMRRMNYGNAISTQRLQRFFEVVELSRD